MILTGSISNSDGSIIRIDAEGETYDGTGKPLRPSRRRPKALGHPH
ncbi:hypothetical protein AB0N64_18220 [Microbacterium sp. NPDC089318]